MNGIIKISPDKERAKSMFKMALIFLERLNESNKEKYPSLTIRDYYEVIREITEVIMHLDRFKAYGEYAHKNTIDYLLNSYNIFSEYESYLINELRIQRNKIVYDGFFITKEFVIKNMKDLDNIIKKLITIAEERLK